MHLLDGTLGASVVRDAQPEHQAPASYETLSLNIETAAFRSFPCDSSELAAAAACSTRAAFCCVTPSICVTAWLTWPMPLLCSCEAAVISFMMSVTRRI